MEDEDWMLNVTKSKVTWLPKTAISQDSEIHLAVPLAPIFNL